MNITVKRFHNKTKGFLFNRIIVLIVIDNKDLKPGLKTQSENNSHQNSKVKKLI